MWSGTTINDTLSVVAAAYTYGNAAGDYSVVVKLTRTLALGAVLWATVGIGSLLLQLLTGPL